LAIETFGLQIEKGVDNAASSMLKRIRNDKMVGIVTLHARFFAAIKSAAARNDNVVRAEISYRTTRHLGG